MNHVIDSKQFDREIVESLIARAIELEGVRNDSQRGRIIATLFYEPSTRTRLSFESAAARLGATVLSTENARGSSSAIKGETVEDTIQVIQNYADLIVMRNHEAGAAKRAAAVSSVPIINAADGSDQHPTQSLIDLLTIKKELGRLDSLRVAMVGDLKYGRTVRSLSYMLTLFKDISITFVSSPELGMADDVKMYLKDRGVGFSETHSLEEGIHDADVIYMTRVQKERFENEEAYQKQKGLYVLTAEHAASLKKDALIMHPLPRIDEIRAEVDDSSHAVYFKQAANGVAMRMALLEYALS